LARLRQALGECKAAGPDREHGVVRRDQRGRSDADLRLHQSRRTVPLDRRRRDLHAHAACVRRAARATLARPAPRHAARSALADAADPQGSTDGMGGGMSGIPADVPEKWSPVFRKGHPQTLKVGLMVPANNTTMEGELAAWLPAGSTVTTVKIPRGPGLLTPETIPAYRDSAIA